MNCHDWFSVWKGYEREPGRVREIGETLGAVRAFSSPPVDAEVESLSLFSWKTRHLQTTTARLDLLR